MQLSCCFSSSWPCCVQQRDPAQQIMGEHCRQLREGWHPVWPSLLLGQVCCQPAAAALLPTWWRRLLVYLCKWQCAAGQMCPLCSSCRCSSKLQPHCGIKRQPCKGRIRQDCLRLGKQLQQHGKLVHGIVGKAHLAGCAPDLSPLDSIPRALLTLPAECSSDAHT